MLPVASKRKMVIREGGKTFPAASWESRHPKGYLEGNIEVVSHVADARRTELGAAQGEEGFGALVMINTQKGTTDFRHSVLLASASVPSH